MAMERGHGAVSTTTTTPCEEIQRQPRRRPRLRWWVVEERLTVKIQHSINKYDHVGLQAEFGLELVLNDTLSSAPAPTFLAHHTNPGD